MDWKVLQLSMLFPRVSKMTIYVRQVLTNRLINELHGGPDQLAAAWEAAQADNPAFPPAKQRSTLYKWTSKGVPTRRDASDQQYFGLCALLDVDPLAIFDFERNGYFSKFARIRQLVYYGRRALGGLATLLDMYRPSEDWPSSAIAKTCYDRNWFSHEFTNRDQWACNDYILLKASFSQPAGSHPRAVHVAYRRVNTADTMWRYYGSVLAIDGIQHLYTEGGDYQTMSQVAEGEIRFRTYYGGRPVEWRVVSLHAFSLDTEFPFNDLAVIGFNW